MIPGVYEFHWDTGHVVFLGGFFLVLLTIATTLFIVSARVRRDRKGGLEPAICWRGDFECLPESRRQCRHAMAGQCAARVCENGFDCASCALHRALSLDSSATAPVASELSAYGIPLSANRLYHRGHTWVEEQEDGSVLVGLDGFARRLLGKVDRIDRPAVGRRVHANQEALLAWRQGHSVPILSPVEGEVLETSDGAGGWYLRLRPFRRLEEQKSLLCASEAKWWLQREVESLQARLSRGEPRVALADGGELMGDLPASGPAAEWESIWADYFLEA